MGIISKLKSLLAKKEDPKSEIQEDIDAYRRQQRQQMKIDLIMANEKHNFLYGESK